MSSKKQFQYKGYQGSVETSIEDEVLYGKIEFIEDLVTYEAETVTDLKAEFEAAVDDYLEFCEEEGKEPEKPCSGSFNVRVGQSVHREAIKSASLMGQSLNDFVTEAVVSAIRQAAKLPSFKCENTNMENFLQEAKKFIEFEVSYENEYQTNLVQETTIATADSKTCH